jgi:Fe-S oxidoreductase
MSFDPFVLPFLIGMIYLLLILSWRYFKWLDELEVNDRYKFIRGLFSLKLFKAIRDVFAESLLHRKIFRVNFFLGFMHMSLAFFWFLLIVVGSFESKLYSKYPFNAPHDPVFFKFFMHDFDEFGAHKYFFFFMDMFLLIILIAVILALTKRVYSTFFGMKKTTRHRLVDRLARIFLWLIFPLRWLAESATAGIHENGGFLTQSTGNVMASFMNLWYFEYPLWWLYSSALGAFFIIMPFSRYMHIPTEIVLIFLRRFGIKNVNEIKGFANFEIQSCSSCGICINTCQMVDAAGMSGQQAVYYLQKLRFKRNFEDPVFNCLMCQRCNYYCPVEIDIAHLRKLNRNKLMPGLLNDHTYLDQQEIPTIDFSAKVIYYAGCMTHLRPGTIQSLTNIFSSANIDYFFADKDGTICCGRPMFMLGATEEAQAMVRKNIEIFQATDAKVLVTSCPICLKMFREEYNLKMHIVHHTEFLKMLVDAKRIKLKKSKESFVYHDPCELGRGLGEFKHVRSLLKHIGNPDQTPFRKNKSLCCGGSLANLRIRADQRKKITVDAFQKLTQNNPDFLITSCPRCEQTFSTVADRPVMDVVEFIEMNLDVHPEITTDSKKTGKLLQNISEN